MAVVGNRVALAPSGLGRAARRGRTRCRERAGHEVDMHVHEVQLRAAATARKERAPLTVDDNLAGRNNGGFMRQGKLVLRHYR